MGSKKESVGNIKRYQILSAFIFGLSNESDGFANVSSAHPLSAGR
jgi:hypothetical protein